MLRILRVCLALKPNSLFFDLQKPRDLLPFLRAAHTQVSCVYNKGVVSGNPSYMLCFESVRKQKRRRKIKQV